MFNKRTTTEIGILAETDAVKYLIKKGYKIVDRNFKNKLCEIDIIAKKDKIIYFVEVKYRHSAFNGDGVDAITPKKLDKMSFAAELWVNCQNWPGEYQLAAISLSGYPAKVDSFITI